MAFGIPSLGSSVFPTNGQVSGTATSPNSINAAASQPYNVFTTGYQPPVVPNSALDRSQSFGDPLGLTQISNAISRLGDTSDIFSPGAGSTASLGGQPAQGGLGSPALDGFSSSGLTPNSTILGGQPTVDGEPQADLSQVIGSFLSIVSTLLQQLGGQSQ